MAIKEGSKRRVLTAEEFELIKGIRNQCKEHGVGLENISSGWLKNKDSSLRFVNPLFKQKEENKIDALAKSLVVDMQKHAPIYPKIKRIKNKDSYCLVVDPADIHIGKLATAFETGESYDSQIAIKRVREGVEGIIQKANGFKIDQIVLVIGNDILHIDTPRRTTTSGTFQDTSGMWYDNFLLAKNLYVDIIEMLLPVANVYVMYNPSNHDYTNGFFLADTVKTWFRNSVNVEFDCSISHRKYYQYFNNLIGTTHGDGAKMTDLPLLMANEAAKQWAQTKHRYIYMHHFHHKISKDFMSVCVEGLRSPSGTDSWHHRNGYQHAPKAIEGFIHCKNHGQIARLTHIF